MIFLKNNCKYNKDYWSIIIIIIIIIILQEITILVFLFKNFTFNSELIVFVFVSLVKHKYTKMYLKYIYFMLSILQIYLHIYVLNKIPCNYTFSTKLVLNAL